MLMNTDEEESQGGEGEEGGEESSEGEPEEDLQARIDALSDDEAKEELREAQLRKLMEESQAGSLPLTQSSEGVRCSQMSDAQSEKELDRHSCTAHGGPMRSLICQT
jgi:hypothetical protein